MGHGRGGGGAHAARAPQSVQEGKLQSITRRTASYPVVVREYMALGCCTRGACLGWEDDGGVRRRHLEGCRIALMPAA